MNGLLAIDRLAAIRKRAPPRALRNMLQQMISNKWEPQFAEAISVLIADVAFILNLLEDEVSAVYDSGDYPDNGTLGCAKDVFEKIDMISDLVDSEWNSRIFELTGITP